MPTDLYGQCCDLQQIVSICNQYDIPVVCDSAEALGAFYQRSEVRSQKSEKDRDQISKTDLRSLTSGLWNHAGVGAKAAVFSFNGNKIITTSGGGMLASDDKGFIDYARKLSQLPLQGTSGQAFHLSTISRSYGAGWLKMKSGIDTDIIDQVS